MPARKAAQVEQYLLSAPHDWDIPVLYRARSASGCARQLSMLIR
jgi:hypothetical protein